MLDLKGLKVALQLINSALLSETDREHSNIGKQGAMGSMVLPKIKSCYERNDHQLNPVISIHVRKGDSINLSWWRCHPKSWTCTKKYRVVACETASFPFRMSLINKRPHEKWISHPFSRHRRTTMPAPIYATLNS